MLAKTVIMKILVAIEMEEVVSLEMRVELEIKG
jgi:hypothetical protein